MTTAVGVVSGSKYGFEFLRRLRDTGREPFAKTMGAIGCYPRSLAHLVKMCRSAGLVQPPVAHVQGYELTGKGFEMLRLWEDMVALDGEPEAAAGSFSNNLGPPTPVAERIARARSAMADPLPMSGGWSFDEPKKKQLAPGERVIELDEDPFAPAGDQ